MYLLADLIIILVFLIGSAVLGFLLGRRSFRGQVDQLQAQVQDRQQTMTDMKTKLKRCTAKRVALEQELTEVRTHLSGQGIDLAKGQHPVASAKEGTPPTAQTTAPEPGATRTTQTTPVRHDTTGTHPERQFPEQRDAAQRSAAQRLVSTTDTAQRDAAQQFRDSRDAAVRPTQPKPAASKHVPKPPSKQEEALARVRARASKVNFERIGTAEARQRDDLKQIKGIGIFTEKKLNALGIYTFEQIARFQEADQQAVSKAIEFFPDRIARDEWVAQARELQKKG